MEEDKGGREEEPFNISRHVKRGWKREKELGKGKRSWEKGKVCEDENGSYVAG